MGGTEIRAGKAIPVRFGCISLNNGDPFIAESKPGDTKITFKINITAGEKTFRAWFKSKDGEDLCGAYYVKMGKLF